LKRVLLAGLALFVTLGASAQEMTSPRVSLAQVNWDQAAASLPDHATGSPTATFARLNAISSLRFKGIGKSSVPVLLPFDAQGFAKAVAAKPEQTPTQKAQAADSFMQAGFHTSNFFLAGPAGYDAAFSLNADDFPALDVSYSKPIYVLFSGLALVYHLGGPPLPDGEPVKELESDFPGIRRYILESYVRYSFQRYGVTYVAAIFCIDGPTHRYLSCREADRVAQRFLRALKLAGGTPQPAPAEVKAVALDRPQPVSPNFTYYSPGDLIPGTGPNKAGVGRVDYTVYARLRFPIKTAPDFANSQSFNSWGNCDFTGRSARVTQKDAHYSCSVNDRPLVFDEAAPRNYSYPWRDNFCEHRHFYVGQCPGGHGHQGQDIRPSYCALYNAGADRCQPYRHDVVAVHDGIILRAPKQQAVYLFVNTASTHLRVRYMHMNPHQLDAAGILSGKVVHEGEVIGKVGNFNGHEHGTTYHLHFDMQVPTRIGWVFVNPYMTLVSAYERLIGARGVEIKPGQPAPPIAGVTPVVEHGKYEPPPVADLSVPRQLQVVNAAAGDGLREVTLPQPRPDKIDKIPVPEAKPRAVTREAERHEAKKSHHKAEKRHRSARRHKATRREASADKKKRRKHVHHSHKKRHHRHH
jgi:murein DD-endopeptidase MepM/ murein hydrolase activator NlpD